MCVNVSLALCGKISEAHNGVTEKYWSILRRFHPLVLILQGAMLSQVVTSSCDTGEGEGTVIEVDPSLLRRNKNRS